MSDPELDRLASAMGRLLRSLPGPGGDDAGWIPLPALTDALARDLGRAVDPDLVLRAGKRGRNFEVAELPVRAELSDGVGPDHEPHEPHGDDHDHDHEDASFDGCRPDDEPATADRAPATGTCVLHLRALRRQTLVHTPPDILYHACTADQVERYRGAGGIRPSNGRAVYLSDDESQAWRAAHRMGGEPRVLYVDTVRQRRRRLKLQRNRRGLYVARSIGLADVLNLQPQFAEQRSAGGIPVVRGPDGIQMALIRVTRRSGVTWEVAKGKLEPGEPPEWAGVREVQEEMGIAVDFEVRDLVGLIRYGFLAPGGLPRLKTVYLYLLEPKGEIGARFNPAAAEGVKDVRWFTPEEACRVVTHSSLRPLMHRARMIVEGR